MIAIHVPWDPVLDTVIVVGIILAAVSYAYAQIRRGSISGTREAIDLANAEIDILKESRDRLQQELIQVREKAVKDIARLEGQVTQLVSENSELRKLIMLESVPPILVETLRKIAEETSSVIQSEMDTRLERIEQGIARLLTKGGEQ